MQTLTDPGRGRNIGDVRRTPVRQQHRKALAVDNGIGAAIVVKLEEYRRLDPALIEALGGDQFAPAPTREILR